MKNLKLFGIAAVLGFALASCGGSGLNEKPTVFYNRQPSDSNGVQKAVMNHTDNTYYAGFDALAGGDVQGKMVADYVKEHAAEMDRNSDGTIGYVLAIGQNSHNDSMARTIGVRRALGTLKDESADADKKQEGSIKANDGKTYKVVELEAKEMRDESGPWSATVAGNTFQTWNNAHKNEIDLVVSNNDGMAETMVAQMKTDKIPTFGYDANASTLDLILAKDSAMKGTVSQNHHAQVLTALQLVRNMLDGLTGADVTTKGFTTPDAYGNQIKSASVGFTADTKAMLAENGVVTKENAAAVKADALDTGIKQTDAKKAKILWTVYSSTDNFLNQSFIPTVDKYKGFYNFDITYIYGDGTQESSLLNSFNDLGSYDAYVINMIETSSGALYQEKLDKAA